MSLNKLVAVTGVSSGIREVSAEIAKNEIVLRPANQEL